jgi:uncharacterized caspase-like protein
MNKTMASSCSLILVFLGVALNHLFAQTSTTQPRSGQNPGTRNIGVPEKAVQQLPEKTKRWALIIGVDEYSESSINRLYGAANDAVILRETLIKYAGFPPEQVILLASGQSVENQPTRGRILRYLSNLRGSLPSDALLFVAFSGHGIEKKGRAFILPSDTELDENATLLEDTAISIERLKTLIRETGVRQVIFSIDACRNDPEAGKGLGAGILTESFSRSFNFDKQNQGIEAFVVLYATAVGSRAYESRQKGNGYYTLVLVDGLKGAAANEKGEIMLGRLIAYLQETVPQQVKRDKGVAQKPFAYVEGYQADKLVLSAVAPPSQAITTPTTNISPLRASSRKDAKANRLLLLVPEQAGGEALAGALAQKFVDQGINVTLSTELTNSDLSRLRDAMKKLAFSERQAGQSIPYAAIVSANISITPREQFQGLFVANARGVIKVIDSDTGATIASESLDDVRGFGNSQAQANEKAWLEVGKALPVSFCKKVAAAIQ